MPIRFLAFILVLLMPASAQDEAKKDAAGPFLVRFLAEHAPPELGKVVLVIGETKSAPITLPTNHLSEPLPVSARTMVLKTEEKGISLCTINLPEVGKAFAVVLVTAKPAGFNPIVVRTDDPTFKAGDVFFINRSDKTVLGKLGGTPLVLKPGASVKNRPSDPVDNTYYDIAFATRDETGDKIISSSRWPIDENLRSYLFFFTDAKGKTNFRAVDEFMVPPAAAKP